MHNIIICVVVVFDQLYRMKITKYSCSCFFFKDRVYHYTCYKFSFSSYAYSSLTVLIFASVNSHICVLKQRVDTSSGKLRWSIPASERCICQRVVAPRIISTHCIDREAIADSALWFIDDPKEMINHENWYPAKLDKLLDREQCGKFTFVMFVC